VNPRSLGLVMTHREVEAGCRELSQDLAKGRIVDVIASYRHTQGDYLRALGEKEGR
jgi:hypothetical protein